MLSQRHLKLLTASVDGELPQRRCKALRRLLHESSEARTLLKDLERNALLLRELPHLPQLRNLAANSWSPPTSVRR